jgi:hypothetical protein
MIERMIKIAKSKGFNEWAIVDGVCQFYIINKKGEKFTVLVDKIDLDRLIEFNKHWQITWHGWDYYATWSKYLGKIKSKSGKEYFHSKLIGLHRWIMNAGEDDYVDHIDPYKTLDNRRYNLRLTTNSKNNQNRKGANVNSSTGVRNVNLGANEYLVQICKDGELHVWKFPLDQFEEACKCAEEKRKELFGEFAGNS